MSLLSRFFALKNIDFAPNSPSTRDLYKESLNIAWPATIEGALISIIGSVDTAMVGTIGSGAIAAVGLTSQPRMIFLIFAQALCVGTTALIARRKGEGDRVAANSVLSQSMFIITFIGIVMSILAYSFAKPFMYFAGANEETIGMATDYFQVISLGFVFNYWSLCLCAGMRAIGKTRITMITNISANIVNVILNYCLINGKFGFPCLGVKGAAIATLCGTIVGCAIAFWFAARPDEYLHFTVKIPHFEKQTLKGLWRVGSSSMIESVCLRVGFLINSMLIARNGTASMAIYEIVSHTTGLSFTLGDGIAVAGSTLVGQSLGAKRKDLAMAHAKISRKLSIVSSIILMIIVFFGRRPIALFFNREENIVAGAMLAFLVVVVGILPQNGRVVFSGCLRGAGDVRYVALCSLISVTILRPSLTYLFCYPLNIMFPSWQFSTTGPWISFVLDAFVREFLLYRRIQKGKWLEIKL